MAIPTNKYTKEQLVKLNKDAIFQKRISSDEELTRLFDPSRDDEELYATYQSLGGCLYICNVVVPPPTLGSIRLLSLVNSPFTSSSPDWDEPYYSLMECLFILIKGSDALQLQSGYFVWRERLNFYKKQAADAHNTVWLDRVLLAEQRLAEEHGRWQLAVSTWANENSVRIDIGETITSTIKTLVQYISMAYNGLNMFPQQQIPISDKEDKKPRQVFDNEGEARVLSYLNEVATIGVDEARWAIPLVTIGHLAAEGGEKRGIKGIGRKPKGEECFERLEKLMDERLKELGS